MHLFITRPGSLDCLLRQERIGLLPKERARLSAGLSFNYAPGLGTRVMEYRRYCPLISQVVLCGMSIEV
jgi:hypothetical protein